MPRGRKPGTPKTGGRQKGTPNTATAEIRDIAKKYGPDAIKEAARLAGLLDAGKGKAESEAARVAALNIVLDRGYGKPSQIIGNDPENPLPEAPTRVEHVIVDPKA